MKRLFIVLFIVVSGQGLLYSQPSPIVFSPQITKPAYLDEVLVRISGIIVHGHASNLSPAERIHNRTYLDGLGRPIQNVVFGTGTVAKPDLVSFSVYDRYGREKKEYLPYATSTSRIYQNNAQTAQAAFYSTGTASGKYVKDNAPYAESNFDNSPLNHVLQQGSAGSAWQLSTGEVKTEVRRTNTAADNVRKFNSNATSTGFWAAGTLNVNQLTDEEGHQVLVFTDKSGNTILKREWVDETIQGSYKDYKNTYYIYHQSGALLMILPPKVVDRMISSGWVLSSDDLDKNIFRYEYDTMGRMVAKKLPSLEWAYLIYDKLDRLCLMQTAINRSANKWHFIKYDKTGRKILEGILQDNTHLTRASMQAYCDTYDYLNPAVPCYESKGGTIKNYTDISFPQSTAFAAFEPLIVNYYDNYDIDYNGTANYSYAAQGLGTDEPVPGPAQGQLTVVSKRKLGTNDWLTSSYFYDNRGLVIQEQSNNVTNLLMNDVQTNLFDFSGLIRRSLKTKKLNSIVHTTDELMTYDNGARLASVSHKYNTNPPVTLADYVYNELGQLVDKNMGKLAPGSYLQSVDLRYNIRGWVTAINNADLTNDSYNDDTNDQFGMEILYQADGGIGNTGLYNGQISGIKWRAKMNSHPYNNVGRAYVYSYDKLGQIRNALFKGNNGSGWNFRNGAFDEKNISYDLNGNILTLERNTWSGAVSSLDKLSYSYKTTGGNDQLKQVIDANGGGGTYGFKNQSADAEHYLYDANGNLIQDKNKNATYSYNDLGKINRVTLLAYTNRYIQYNYDGSGTCLSKQVVDNGSTVKTTSYIADFVVVDNVLSYINTAEGRLRTTGAAGTYEYYIKDHLGNVRVSFENVGGVASVRQENSFYAFGLVHNATIVPSGENKKIVPGSDWENDFGNDPDLYTMPYRQYDPVLGRFNAVDPMAEKYDDLSVYNFCFNNPVSFSDPTGADPIGTWEELWKIIEELLAKPYGGNWGVYQKIYSFQNNWDALWNFDMAYGSDIWANTGAGSFQAAFDKLGGGSWKGERTPVKSSKERPELALEEVNINETYSNSNWLSERQRTSWFAVNNIYNDNSNSRIEISPLSFQFERTASNWRAAAVSNLTMSISIKNQPGSYREVKFNIEVGVPIKLKDKTIISPDFAAKQAAWAANQAAVVVGGLYATQYFDPTVSSRLPKQFAAMMQSYLGIEIGGARVNSPIINKSLKPTPAIFTGSSWLDKLFGL